MNLQMSTLVQWTMALIVVTIAAMLGKADAGVASGHGHLQTSGFEGAAWYGRDAGAGGFAGASLVSPLASSGFASPYGAIGGNYGTGLRFLPSGGSAGFGGFGASGKGTGNHLSASTGSVYGGK